MKMTPSQKRRAERRKHLQKKQPRETRLRFVGGRTITERLFIDNPERVQDHVRAGGLR